MTQQCVLIHMISAIALVCPASAMQWETLPKMSTGRYGAAAVCIDEQIIVAGGKCDSCGLPGFTATVESYDLETSTWSYVSSLPWELYLPSACVVDGRMLL